MSPNLKKHLLTHGLVVFGFLAITFLVHHPTFVSGKQIEQHDILQGKGGSQQLKDYRTETGEEALWNPNMFSGMPAYLTGVRYSGDLLQYVSGLAHLYLPRAASILFLSFLSFYIMMLTFKVNPWVAFAAAIAFGLNGFNIIGTVAGHNAKIDAVAFMPLVLAGIQLTFTGKKWLGFGLTALALGLQIKSNHPQITYYLMLVVLGYGFNQLFHTIKGKGYKDFGIKTSLLVVAAMLAVGANFGRLSTTLEYSQYTIRGKSELKRDQASSSGLDREYAFKYSNGIIEPLFLFVPNIFGGPSQQELSTKSEVANALRSGGYNRTQVAQQVKAVPTYWGDQPLTAPYYAGTITVLLFILGVVILPRNQKVWLISLAALGIMMSWGGNFGFNDMLFDHLPGYNKFRSVTFAIIATIFCINLLGFVALDKLIKTEWDPAFRKKVFLSLGIGIGLLLFFLIFSGALFSYRGAVDAHLPDWLVDALKKDRRSLLVKDSLRGLFFAIGFSVLVWAQKANKLRLSYSLAGICFLVFMDSFMLGRRFIDSDTFVNSPNSNFFRQTEADQVLLSTAGPGDRVLNLQNPFNENRTSYFHESIGGYHGAKIRRYQDLIDYCISHEIQEASQSLQAQSLDFSGLQVLNMLNAKYFYAGNQRNGVFRNNTANGPAWTVNEVILVNSADEEINKVCGIDTKNQAVIDQTKFDMPKASGSGTIQLTEKSPNKIVYKANVNGGSSLGIFSEIYYPKGWVATVDGNEVDILRANYVLRALEIAEGSHEIIFEFKPTKYYLGNTVTLVSSAVVILVFVGSLFLEVKEQNAPS